MPYCPTCAVEIEDRHPCCPLCGMTVADQCPSIAGGYPQQQHVPLALPASWSALRRKIYTTITVLLAVPLLIVFFLDLNDEELTWSLYVIAALTAIWAAVGVGLYQAHHAYRLAMAQWIIAVSMLVALDLCDRSIDWSLLLGLPLMVAIAVTLGPVLALWTTRRLHLFNGVAWLLWSLGLLCVAIEVIIENHRGHPPVPNWSLIPLASLILVGLFFLYLHVRVARHVNLDKWFHL